MAEMYVIKGKSLYELRQARFRAQLQLGAEHPHDVCAFARSVEEMHRMADKHWPDANYSAVEPNTPTSFTLDTPADLEVFRRSRANSPVGEAMRQHLQL